MADHLEDSTLVSKTPKIILWLLLAFTFFLIGFISNFLFASTIDAQHYAFNVTWLDSAKTNYSELNGRWAQGFTNDYRFYVHRVLSTLGVNIFFFFSIWYFFSALLRKFAFVVAGMFYFAFILNCFNYYQIAYLLNTSLSYTFGVSLMFVLYGWIIRNKRGIKFFISLRGVLSIMIVVFITGLLEHLFVLNGIILFFIIFIKLFNKKLDFVAIILSIINVLGSVFMLKSPGLQKRRQQSLDQDFGSDNLFDYQLFLDNSIEQLLLNTNLFSFLLFLFFLLALLNKSTLKINFRLSTFQFIVSLLFIIFIPIVPILLGFVGSNGVVGMPKAYNLFSLIFLLSLFFLVMIVISFCNLQQKIKIKTQNINIIATIFLLGIGFLYFFNHNNKLSYEQHQVFSYDIQNPYYQELALREYLLDYYHVYAEKFIPRVQKNFDKPVHGTISSDQFMQYFHKRFNNNIPIRFSEKIIPPREFVTASNIVNHKIKELYKSTDGTSIFYDDKLKTIGLRTNDSVLINKLSRLSIEVEGNIFLKQKKQKIDINAKRERKVYATFYDKNPQLFLIELPLWTETFTIQPLGVKINTQQAEIREKSTYNTEYGNIMR